MFKKTIMCVCDICGRTVEARHSDFGDFYVPPQNWKDTHRDFHMCPDCAAAFEDIKRQKKRGADKEAAK